MRINHTLADLGSRLMGGRGHDSKKETHSQASAVVTPLAESTIDATRSSHHNVAHHLHDKWKVMKNRITEAHILDRLHGMRPKRHMRAHPVPDHNPEESSTSLHHGQGSQAQVDLDHSESHHKYNLLSTLKKMVHIDRHGHGESEDKEGHGFFSYLHKKVWHRGRRTSAHSRQSQGNDSCKSRNSAAEETGSEREKSGFRGMLQSVIRRRDSTMSRKSRRMSTVSNQSSFRQKESIGFVSSIKRRIDLRSFLMSSRQAKREAWEELHENPSLIEEGDDESYTLDSQEASNICSICCGVTMYKVNGYPCRVCGRVFHKTCLQDTGRYTDQELSLSEKALTDLPGWSCEECDNLCNLLTPEEQDSIYNVFCSVDIDRDASLKLKEYLNYKQRVCQLKQNRNLTPEEKTLEEEQFDHLDVDGSGELEYWEFMKNEAALKLKERGEDELVDLLTPKEKAGARRVFKHLEHLGNGLVSRDDMPHDLLRQWYCNMEMILEDHTYRNMMPGQTIGENKFYSELMPYTLYRLVLTKCGEISKGGLSEDSD